MPKTSSITLWCILLTVLLTVSGQLLVKHGVQAMEPLPASVDRRPAFVLKAFTSIPVLAGLCCSLLAAITWVIALARAPLSFAQPFMSLGPVLTLALAGPLLQENVPWHRWLGVLLVCAGLVIAAR